MIHISYIYLYDNMLGMLPKVNQRWLDSVYFLTWISFKSLVKSLQIFYYNCFPYISLHSLCNFSSCRNPYRNALKIQITTAELCEEGGRMELDKIEKPLVIRAICFLKHSTSCSSSSSSSSSFSYSPSLYCEASKWNLVSCISHSLLVLTLCVFARITLKNLLRITQTLDLSMCGRRKENCVAAFSSTSSENNHGSLTNHLPGRNK